MVANRRRILFRYAIRHHVKVLCGAVAVMNSMVVGNGEGSYVGPGCCRFVVRGELQDLRRHDWELSETPAQSLRYTSSI